MYDIKINYCTHRLPPLIIDARKQSTQPRPYYVLSLTFVCSHVPSACTSFAALSLPAVFIEATIVATAGTGVVDLLIFAACNL